MSSRRASVLLLHISSPSNRYSVHICQKCLNKIKPWKICLKGYVARTRWLLLNRDARRCQPVSAYSPVVQTPHTNSILEEQGTNSVRLVPPSKTVPLCRRKWTKYLHYSYTLNNLFIKHRPRRTFAFTTWSSRNLLRSCCPTVNGFRTWLSIRRETICWCRHTTRRCYGSIWICRQNHTRRFACIRTLCAVRRITLVTRCLLLPVTTSRSSFRMAWCTSKCFIKFFHI